jgi:DNA-binding MarR family transcriptional regulator
MAQRRSQEERTSERAMSSTSDDQTSDRDETESLIAQVLALLAKVTERFESQENEETRWLAQHSHSPLVVELLRDSTVTTLRVVDAIGRLEPVNGITISAHHRIPKGTVSKVTRRLVAQKLVSTESLPNNKKQVLFRLTPLGSELFAVHRAFDEQMERGFRRFLRRYDPAELGLLVRVLSEATEASFLTLGLQATAAREQAPPRTGA